MRTPAIGPGDCSPMRQRGRCRIAQNPRIGATHRRRESDRPGLRGPSRARHESMIASSAMMRRRREFGIGCSATTCSSRIVAGRLWKNARNLNRSNAHVFSVATQRAAEWPQCPGRGAANDPSPRPSASVIWACGEKRGFSAGDEIARPSRLKSPGQTFIRARAQRETEIRPGALCASSGQVSPAIKRKQETYAQGSQKRRSVDHGDLITGGRELLVATAAPRGRRRTSPFAGFASIQSPHGHRLIPVGEPHSRPSCATISERSRRAAHLQWSQGGCGVGFAERLK